MRDPERIPKVLGLLEKAWKLSPDFRLGQMIFSITKGREDNFYTEDEELTKFLEEFIRKNE